MARREKPVLPTVPKITVPKITVPKITVPKITVPKIIVPKAAAARLSLYLRYLEELQRRGETTTSSHHLGAALSVTAAQVRKDLGYFGQFGFPGVGYKLAHLVPQIRRILGTDRSWNVAIVGIGNLGSALVQHRGFEKGGFRIALLFDNHPRVCGRVIGGLTVHPMTELEPRIAAESVKLGIVAVPASAAQEVADQLVKAGIRGIFNFAPVVLSLPEDVGYVSIDLAVQLEQLTFFVSQLEQAGTTGLPEDDRASEEGRIL
jgi:redox-sensing transcriptional repressor